MAKNQKYYVMYTIEVKGKSNNNFMLKVIDKSLRNVGDSLAEFEQTDITIKATHGEFVCPFYNNEIVLPDEYNKCSLCGSSMLERLNELANQNSR